MFKTGSAGGYTGSPLDGNNCTNCHAGSAAIAVSDWIETDIPVEGYTPGQTYNITVNASHGTSEKIGFEFTAEANGAKVDNYDLAGNTEVITSKTTQSVTHSENGALTNTPGTKTYNFKWVAPSAGTGEVTFYAAINGTNFNNLITGDQIYLTNLTVSEDVITGLGNYKKLDENKDFFYPNPVKNTLYLKDGISGNVTIRDLSGNIVLEMNSGSELDISYLESGAYVIKIESEDQILSSVVVKK